MKKRTRKIVRGCETLVILGLIMACGNALINTYGETLAQYTGDSGSSTGTDGEEGEYTVETCLAEGRAIDAEIESEGSVLLRNENNTLPLAKGSKVTILGAQSYNYVNGGTGSAGG